jgi:triphosphoribosyl-dephospho-CoA synthase
MEAAASTGVGRAVYDAVAATGQVVSTNTNLGMALLFAPLAAVPRGEALSKESAGAVLRSLTPDDSRLVYEAIRLAQPGSLGTVESMDIASAPPRDLLAAMQAAADRDLIARQYVENFCLVFEEALATLVAGP